MTQIQTIITNPQPQGRLTIPPVMGLKDILHNTIALDQEVIMDRLGLGTKPWVFTCPVRARVVGIGDGGLPGRDVIKVRPYGSNYIETAGPDTIMVHEFDDCAWLEAEEAAADTMMTKKIDLGKCLFGGFYFEHYQKFVALYYAMEKQIELGLPVIERYRW